MSEEPPHILLDINMARVAIVGHSQVPKYLYVPGVDLRIFRAPGGRAYNFFSDSRLNPVLEWQNDITLLWLGSNDIDQDTQSQSLVTNIIEIVEAIEDSCDSTVYPIQIEPRSYPDEYIVSNDSYKKVQRAVNRKLKRCLKGKCFIHFNTAFYVEHLAADGVHWDEEGKQHVRDRLEYYIESIVNENVKSDKFDESDSSQENDESQESEESD